MRILAVALTAALLAGCATKPEPIVITMTPAPPIALEAPRLKMTQINRGLSPAAAVWHMRVGLNVAALACRGAAEPVIVARYNAMLGAQKAQLAAAEAALSREFQATGGKTWRDGYDDAMTKLYNFFSQAQARDAFCAAAEQVLADAQTVAPEAIVGFASTKLAALDAPFARAFAPMAPASMPAPVIAVAASVPRTPAPAPRLELDLSSLSTER